jgi:hypothetical protein
VQADADDEADAAADEEGADVTTRESPTDDPVDAADLCWVQVSKLPSARSKAVLKSGSCCFKRKLFMIVVVHY